MGSKYNTKYTKEILEPIVLQSISVAQVLRKLKLRECGSIHAYLSKRIRDLEINTSHFLGRRANSIIKNYPTKTPWQQLLVKRTTGGRQKSRRLRRALIELGRAYICESCGLGSQWNNKSITLQINHKNRDWLDDRQENIEFLCPNCHSQTEGWCGSKNKFKIKKEFKSKPINLCRICNVLKKTTKGHVCKKCYNKYRDKFTRDTIIYRKVARPSYQQLLDEIKNTSYVAVGKKYGVSDNAIRKWLKQYKKHENKSE